MHRENFRASDSACAFCSPGFGFPGNTCELHAAPADRPRGVFRSMPVMLKFPALSGLGMCGYPWLRMIWANDRPAAGAEIADSCVADPVQSESDIPRQTRAVADISATPS